MPVLQAVEALNGIFDTCVRSGDYAAPFYPIRIPDHAADIHVSGFVFLPDITVLFILYFVNPHLT